MAVARFLQLSDVHLGRPFGWLPADRAKQRRREQRQAVERAVREAIEREVHAILVPGDLFDQEGADPESLPLVVHAFSVTGCPPVFIAPGNHDPYAPSSPPWDPRALASRGLAWPSHVHVFGSPAWEERAVPGLSGVRIFGRCFAAAIESGERPLADDPFAGFGPAGHSGFDVALFHGSREGACPPGQKITAPFSDEEAQRASPAYLAVGHYHAGTRLTAEGSGSAGVKLAYAGSTVALDMTERGVHGALEVRVEYGFRQPFVEIDFVQLDPRQVFEVSADVTGCASAEQVDERIERALGEARVGEADLATVRLSGRLARGVRYSAPGPSLAERAFHLKLDLRRVRPDYDLDAYREGAGRTTEERFARELLDRLAAEDDPEQRALLERALYYGLDAFTLREVSPAYEELDA